MLRSSIRLWPLLGALSLVACGSGSSLGDDDAADDDDSTDDDDDSAAHDDDDDDTTDDDDDVTDPVDALCARWLTDRAALAEGTWTGSVDSCDAGDTGEPGRSNALTQVNLYRWLAGLNPVETSATLDAAAQECALLAQANGALSHWPPESWTCWSAAGSAASGGSSIAPAGGVAAVDMYMLDMGNPSTMGHRRWILSNWLGPIGLGSASSFSCMHVVSGSGGGGAPWVAWPSPGLFPHDAMGFGYYTVDGTGWTIQSDSIALSNAEVSVSRGGDELPVEVVSLTGGYGSNYALNVLPDGWSTEAGATYDVSVTGASEPISYSVQMVSCD